MRGWLQAAREAGGTKVAARLSRAVMRILSNGAAVLPAAAVATEVINGPVFR